MQGSDEPRIEVHGRVKHPVGGRELREKPDYGDPEPSKQTPLRREPGRGLSESLEIVFDNERG